MTRASGRAGRLRAVLVFVVVSALAVALLPAGLVTAAEEPAVDPFGEHTPIMVVLDTSSSMEEEMADTLGGSRLDSAQSALLDLVGALGADQPYGMVAYPGRDSETVDGCSIGRLETRLAPLNPPQASAEIRRMAADGDTPTGPALLHASDEIRERFGEASAGVIVLVSDGESNCGTPPCDVAKEIRAAGIDVQVNTVGLELDGAGKDELQCIADATGGRYVGATDSEGLIDAITGSALGRMAVSVAAPESVSVINGSGTSAGGSIAVTVTSNGRVAAADVRVSLSLNLNESSAGSVLVPRPVRFLGNLGVDADPTVTFDVRPDDDDIGTATWTVTVTARNARAQIVSGELFVSDTLGRASLGPLFDGITRVAVVGDSYSSGEGTESDYIAGTNGEDDGSKCHRSERTYASVLWEFENVDLIACSGAVTSNFFEPQKSGAADVTPQLTVLREAALSDEPPQAVVLSIGGNDAGFADIAKSCIYGGKLFDSVSLPGGFRCDQGIMLDITGWKDNRTDAIERALNVKPDIVDVLRAVDTAVNDPAALRKRGGRIAPIVLLPYPRLLPETTNVNAPGGCVFGIGSTEAAFLNDFVDTLNTSVELAAYTVRSEGRPVYVVPDVVDAFQPDHTVCEGGSESYAVFDSVEKIGKLRISALLGVNNLLHPNARGHEAMARSIAAWSNTAAAQKRQVTTTVAWDPDVVTGEVSWVDKAASDILFPGHSRTSPGEPLTVSASGFAPGVPVVVRMESTPTVLGTVEADADGNVSMTVHTPADAPLGDHHVVVMGYDEEGAPRAQASELRVMPVGGRWLVPLIVAGAVLVLEGAVGLLLALRRRRTRHPDAAVTPRLGLGDRRTVGE